MIVYIIAGVLFILDQIIKFIIQREMFPGESIPLLEDIFHITYVQNTGAAFGIFKGHNLLFILISLAALVFILFFSRKILGKTLLPSVSRGLILGGIISNLIDRIRLGSVIDFLDFQVWPVFNLADSGISIGAVLLIIQLLKSDK